MIQKINQIPVNFLWNSNKKISKHLFPKNDDGFFLIENFCEIYTSKNLGWSNMWKLHGGLTHGSIAKGPRAKNLFF
jgi:hypothetical protein